MVELEKSHLFGRLPKEDLARLAEVAEERHYEPGAEIFKEGDPGDGVYVVREGTVEISATLGRGERQVLSRVGPGDVFGEMSLLDQHSRSACATAQGAVTVYFVPREPAVALLKRSAELALILTQEISERLREFNRQYVETVLQAERMSVVGRFASSIIHDLKNPLTIIGMAAQSACREGATAEARATAQERINKQIERITNLVNDILEFTRGSQAAPALCAVPWDEFVESVVNEFRLEVERKRVQVEIQGAVPEVKPEINPRRLSRVFYNLIHNAVDAMPHGGTVTLRFEVAGSELRTHVEDSGMGIPEEILPQIFDAFTTFGKAKGTGLGLAICRRIVEEHHGKITAANSKDGSGAVFTFTLPL